MIKKTLIFFLTIIALMPLMANQTYFVKFISSDISSIAAGGTATNGTDFTSSEIDVRYYSADAAIQVWFNPGSATAYNVDFYFQASVDTAYTWDTDYYIRIRVPMNRTASSGQVIITKGVDLGGISTLRLWKVVVNDPSNGVANAGCRIGLNNQI